MREELKLAIRNLGATYSGHNRLHREAISTCAQLLSQLEAEHIAEANSLRERALERTVRAQAAEAQVEALRKAAALYECELLDVTQEIAERCDTMSDDAPWTISMSAGHWRCLHEYIATAFKALSTPAEERPFVHVDDLNDPILAALANPEPGQCDYCLERDGKHVADCEEAAPAEESSVEAHRLLENGSCTGCERCKRGEIDGCDDGSWVELGASAGGAHRLGMWGWIELIFHDADGSESRREYVATDPPTESAAYLKLSVTDRALTRHLIREMREAIAASQGGETTITTGPLDPCVLEQVLYIAMQHGCEDGVRSAEAPKPAAASSEHPAEQDAHELTKALTGLVGGGSEMFVQKRGRFLADIPYCVERIRDRLHRAERRSLAALVLAKNLTKSVEKARDLILGIGDRLGDEGDRVYLGSTNDADTIRNLGRELADLVLPAPAEARSEQAAIVLVGRSLSEQAEGEA